MVEWAKENAGVLGGIHELMTGKTCHRPQNEAGLRLERFFDDPMTVVQHNVNMKSVLRLAILYETLLA